MGDGDHIERDTLQTSFVATIVGKNGLERWAQFLNDRGNVRLLLDVCHLEVSNDWLENFFEVAIYPFRVIDLLLLIFFRVEVFLPSIDIAIVFVCALGLRCLPWSLGFDTFVN